MSDNIAQNTFSI